MIMIIIIVAPGLVASAIGVECWSSVAAVVQRIVALFAYCDHHVNDEDDDGDDNLAGEERIDIREITKLKVVVVAALKNHQFDYYYCK